MTSSPSPNLSHDHCADFSLKHAVLFVKIAAAKSLTEVAAALHISTSGVSRALTELETHVGSPLIRRDVSHKRLTEVGEIFLVHAKRIVEYGLEFIAATRSANTGHCAANAYQRSDLNTVVHITLAQLNALVAVAQAGGFGLAARLNGQKQGTLSYQVKSLEVALGASLLQRISNGVLLTPLGECIVPIAEKLLAANMQAKNSMQVWSANKGKKLMIAGSLSVLYSVMSLLAQQFNVIFPDLHIDIHNGQSDEVEQLVRQGKAIVGVSGVVNRKPEFIYTDLLEAPVGLLWSPQMVIPSVINSLDELAAVPFVRLSGQAAITQLMELHQINFPAYFDAAITVETGNAGLELVTSGTHAMIVTAIAAGRYSEKKLIYLPLQNLLPSITVSIISLRDGPYDDRRQAICEVLADCVLNSQWHEGVRLVRKPHFG